MKKNLNSVLFWLLLFIMLGIICSPILIKIDVLKSAAKWFLLDLDSMKSSYLGMLGTLFGSCLAITGALWTQNNIKDDNDIENTKLTANLIVFNIENTLNDVLYMYISNCFDLDMMYHKIKIIEKWDEKILIISKHINSSQIKALLQLYTELDRVSEIIIKIINCSDEIELSTMSHIYNASNPTTTQRNLSVETYIYDCKIMIKNLVKETICSTFLDQISLDLEAEGEIIKKCEIKENELEDYETKGKIDDVSSSIAFKNELKELHKSYKILCKEHSQIWEELRDTLVDNLPLNIEYKELINSIKKIYT